MADAKKPTKKTEAKDEPKNEPERYKGWDLSRVFWGLLLVLVGVLVLLDNFGVVEVYYQNVWQLWPLFIVGWGISLLNIQGSWWRPVSAALLIGSIGLIGWAALGAAPFDTENQTSSETQQVETVSDDIERLDVSVRAGAGNLVIDSRSSDVPVDAKLRGDSTELTIDSRADGTTQKVDVSTTGVRTWWIGDFQNDLDVQLSRNWPMQLEIKTGASDLEADLSELQLERLSLDAGANDSVVTLGDEVEMLDVALRAGASSLTLRVPEDSGVRVVLNKGLASQDLPGLNDKGDGRYETDNYETAENKISITGSLGAASFTLERY